MTARLYVVRDGRYVLSEGRPASHVVDYERFSRRYVEVFPDVVIVGRLYRREDPHARPVDGPGVRFLDLPGYVGPLGLLRSLPAIAARLMPLLSRKHAFILRLPAATPLLFGVLLILLRIPYAVELVGDPHDALSPKVKRGLLVPLFRTLMTVGTRVVCRSACAVSYVTEHALQRRYPPGAKAFTTHYTSLDLQPEAFAETPRQTPASGPVRMVSVGAMDHGLKGYDVLLRAMAEAVRVGADLTLECVGDGDRRAEYEALATTLGLSDRVRFVGRLPAGAAVRDRLAAAHLFVLASRQEGLPRALIEAMAQGLPAVATDVGGTDELLQPPWLVAPDDVSGLSASLTAMISDRARMGVEAGRNLEIARRYEAASVGRRRRAFYEAVRQCAQTGS